MKFSVSMKNPDALDDAIVYAVTKSTEGMDISPAERKAIQEVRREEAREICQRWFEYGEYLRVEIDTEAKTCVVTQVSR